MINGKKIGVVLPAYNAAKTLKPTLDEIPYDIVDEVILTDDCSQDDTAEVAAQLGIKHIIRHEKNRGYGGNQKTCYKKAIELGCDIIVMLHPDYQYTPKLIHAMCYTIADGVYPVVIASRILGKGARKGGMPLYKYVANRFLTFFQNLMMNQKLSEYHTGYRAFAREVIENLNLEADSDDFVFDNQMIAQIFYAGYEIAEVTCPTKYFKEASSINFKRSVKYGFGVIFTSINYFLAKTKIKIHRIFKAEM
ncbi:MAG: glycosyltransferase family 2 protein [Bacteroidales bacterium]|nr:glycosyltransferase family 2 protein [Bacteroidales bacterium]